MGTTAISILRTAVFWHDLQGWASPELYAGRTPPEPSMSPLLDAILEHVPAPPGDPSGPFAMLVTMTERDSFLGRVATGRIASGQIKVGDKIRTLRHSGELFSACLPGFAQHVSFMQNVAATLFGDRLLSWISVRLPVPSC